MSPRQWGVPEIRKEWQRRVEWLLTNHHPQGQGEAGAGRRGHPPSPEIRVSQSNCPQAVWVLAWSPNESELVDEVHIEPLGRFLVFWGNADWDLQIVTDAKRLYASLSAQLDQAPPALQVIR